MGKLKTCEIESQTPTNGGSRQMGKALDRVSDVVHLQLPSVLIGRIAAVDESGEPRVDFPGNTSGELVRARSLVSITPTDSGREVALTFEDGDAAKPIIAGLFATPKAAPGVREVKLDDQSLVLSAKREVVIQCGKASITLTAAGKVLIQGEYVLSRSAGVNKIRGGSIQLN